MEKKFKPFDKVLYKSERDKKWHCRYYDQWDEESQLHLLTDDSKILDSNILPYEGNESLVGTVQNPDEEVRLEEGEWMVFCDEADFAFNADITVGVFSRTGKDVFHLKHCYERFFEYAIPYKNFNPNDMEETSRHILCVKNGKILRYKG